MSMHSRRWVLVVLALLAGVGSAQAQFVSGDITSEEGMVPGSYASAAQLFNSLFDLPVEVRMSYKPCGAARAYYASGEIVVCTELGQALVTDLGTRDDLGGVLSAFASIPQSRMVVFHQVGHALIDVFDVAVDGDEELVADQVAGLALAAGALTPMWASEVPPTGGARTELLSMATFAEEHGFDATRYARIACWIYGAEPEARAYILADVQCRDDEYDNLWRAWKRLLEPHLKDPAVLGRGYWDTPAAPLRPERNASGQWRFLEILATADGESRCTSSGTLGLWHFEARLAGKWKQDGMCSAPNRLADNSSESVIQIGESSADGISFILDNCRYEGAFTDESRMNIEGAVTCQGRSAATEMRGTWWAVR